MLPVTGWGLDWPSTLSKVAALLHSGVAHKKGWAKRLTSSTWMFKKKKPTSILLYFQKFTGFIKGNMKCLSIFRSLIQGCIYFVNLSPLFFPPNPLHSSQGPFIFSFIDLKALFWCLAQSSGTSSYLKVLVGEAGRISRQKSKKVPSYKYLLLNSKFQKSSKTCYIWVQIPGPHNRLEDHWV